jgi:hypothetical protein
VVEGRDKEGAEIESLRNLRSLRKLRRALSTFNLKV